LIVLETLHLIALFQQNKLYLLKAVYLA